MNIIPEGVIIHVLIAHIKPYAQWGCICVESLIRVGNVNPKNIVVSLDKRLYNTIESNVFKSMGVTLIEFDIELMGASKMTHVAKLFEDNPFIHRIIQLDADMVLTENMDFLKTIDTISSKCDVATYKSVSDRRTEVGSTVFKSRGKCLLESFRYDVDKITRKRFEMLIRNLYFVELEDFEKWLIKKDWIHGGIIILNRTILESSKIWNAIKSFSLINWCDESCLELANFAIYSNSINENYIHKYLNNDILNFRWSPNKFSINEGRGILHFSGNWYRTDNPEISNILQQTFEKIEQNYYEK